jgi:hypothetical protein
MSGRATRLSAVAATFAGASKLRREAACEDKPKDEAADKPKDLATLWSPVVKHDSQYVKGMKIWDIGYAAKGPLMGLRCNVSCLGWRRLNIFRPGADVVV